MWIDTTDSTFKHYIDEEDMPRGFLVDIALAMKGKIPEATMHDRGWEWAKNWIERDDAKKIG